MMKLTSLQQLDIIDCPGMTTLPPAIHHLTSLKILIIMNCKDLNFSEEDNEGRLEWQMLRNLEDLQFENMEKLTYLPKGIQRVPTLRRLIILSCPNLLSLPVWITNLNRLQVLILKNCPHLIERCSDNSGADWTKIARIPKIWVNGKLVQMDGHYKG